MLRFARESDVEEFIIATEEGLLHPLRKANPGKRFHLAAPHMICRAMKQVTLENLLEALEKGRFVIRVPEEIRRPAKHALDRMLEASRG
jgi:quinolinate synthase